MSFSREFLADRGRHLTAKLIATKEAIKRIGILPAAKMYKEAVHIPEIIAAQKRLEEGVYGGCIDCKELIEINRLMRHPHVARCVDCQEIKEKKDISDI